MIKWLRNRCTSGRLRPSRGAPSRGGAAGLCVFLAIVLMISGQVRAADPEPIPKEIQDAVKALGTADDAGRQAFYDLVTKKGDARLIPILNAYRDGSLRTLDARVIIYGAKTEVPGKGKALPILDAFTLQQLTDAKGAPEYLYASAADPTAPGVMRLPPTKRAERAVIAELISSLSLLDPDPVVRIQSIRDAGEKAGRAIVDPEEEARFTKQLNACAAALQARGAKSPADAAIVRDPIAAIQAALAEHATKLLDTAPSASATSKVVGALRKLPKSDDAGFQKIVDDTAAAGSAFQDRLGAQQKMLDELAKTHAALAQQLEKDPKSRFAPALHEAVAMIDAVTGDRGTQLSSVKMLGDFGSTICAGLLHKIADSARHRGDTEMTGAANTALAATESYQTRVSLIQNTFAGASSSSILILLALGLSITFGLMGVINMAHGEFMMVGAFTTYMVSEFFHRYMPGAFDWYPLAAIPLAFIVAGLVGLLCEMSVIRLLYGRPLETLLATWGLSLVLIQKIRGWFGDSLSVHPPSWMSGGWEVSRDLILPLNRVYIIIYCVICISAVWFVVNKTKLGLLLRATTQNRAMASALGVPTRAVDALTFAFGAGLAGLAGCAVPMFDKINPGMGQAYVVDSFMVVVVGGVGKLAGAIWAGLGLGFFGKYLEPLLNHFPTLASSSSVIGKVIVLGLIVVFLQFKPSGLFPPKGRMADA